MILLDRRVDRNKGTGYDHRQWRCAILKHTQKLIRCLGLVLPCSPRRAIQVLYRPFKPYDMSFSSAISGNETVMTGLSGGWYRRHRLDWYVSSMINIETGQDDTYHVGIQAFELVSSDSPVFFYYCFSCFCLYFYSLVAAPEEDVSSLPIAVRARYRDGEIAFKIVH